MDVVNAEQAKIAEDGEIMLTEAGDAITGASVAVTRVQEDAPEITGVYRWVGAIDTATASAGLFSITTPATTSARFGAGVGTSDLAGSPASLHAQLGDASRPVLVVT